MLHGTCVGEEAAVRNIVYFRVKWLQPGTGVFEMCCGNVSNAKKVLFCPCTSHPNSSCRKQRAKSNIHNNYLPISLFNPI